MIWKSFDRYFGILSVASIQVSLSTTNTFWGTSCWWAFRIGCFLQQGHGTLAPNNSPKRCFFVDRKSVRKLTNSCNFNGEAYFTSNILGRTSANTFSRHLLGGHCAQAQGSQAQFDPQGGLENRQGQVETMPLAADKFGWQLVVTCHNWNILLSFWWNIFPLKVGKAPTRTWNGWNQWGEKSLGLNTNYGDFISRWSKIGLRPTLLQDLSVSWFWDVLGLMLSCGALTSCLLISNSNFLAG